jgi:hypothetical protein
MTAAEKLATYEDLLSVPEHHLGQIAGGLLHVALRPALDHAIAASTLGAELDGPFRRGKGGPFGASADKGSLWLILDAPEVHLMADVVVPDLAGWRRERLSEIPRAPFLSLAPDWVCEVLSPSTAAFDRGAKLKVYARENVAHVWLVDPAAKTLEVLVLDGPSYRIGEVFSGDRGIRAIPFDAIELDLGALWNMG